MDRDIDALITEALQEKFDNIACQPSEETWDMILKSVRKNRRQEIIKKLRPAFAVGVLIFLTVLFINFQKPIMAFADKVIKSIEQISGDTLKINKSVMNNDNVQKSDDPRLDEAKKEVSFQLLLPGYIPEGYILKDVEAHNTYKERESVIFHYSNTNDVKKYIAITQQSFPPGTNVTMNIQKNEDTIIKHMDVDDIEYTLVDYGINVKLIWDIGNVSYKIDGNINEEDVMKIAESMK